MVIYSLWRWCVPVLVHIGMILTPLTGSAATLGTSALIKWSCPTPVVGAPTPYDVWGSIKLARVVDSAGNDFEIHCIATFLGFHYEYYVSFPNGTKEELSQCIYTTGLNDAQVIYTGTLTSTVNAAGTPILTVGSIEIVEHSNIEGTSALTPPIKPKKGGRDFHIVHDYRNGHRYRLNTIVGRGTPSSDILSRSFEMPGTSILRAGVSVLASQSAFGPALAGDTAFRKLDDSTALTACENCTQHPSIDSPATQLQISRVTGGGHSGMVIADPEFRGSTFASMPTALVATVPALAGRKLATMAIEMTLLSSAVADTRVAVDGQIVGADILEHDGMLRIVFPLDASSHEVRVGEHAEWDLFWVFGIGFTIALLALMAFSLSRRER